MVGVHMREENSIQLLGRNVQFCEPHHGAPASIKLQLHGGTIVAVFAVAHECSGPSQTLEGGRTSLSAC